MFTQLHNWGILAAAHAKTLGHKLIVGSKPATRVPAPQVASATPPSLLTRITNSLYAYGQAITLVKTSPHFPDIYIGSGWRASYGATYKQIGIDCVLNCADKLPSFYRDKIVFYQHIAMVDDAGGYIDFVCDADFRTTVFHFVRQLYDDTLTRRKEGLAPRKLLIHCVFGRSRSVAITILILFLLAQLEGDPKTISDLYRDIYKLRPLVKVNCAFYEPLLNFEKTFNSNGGFRKSWMTVFTPIPTDLN